MPTQLAAPTLVPTRSVARARSRRALASSAHCCSSALMVESCEVLEGTMSVSHSTGKAMRASAYSSVPTPGTV